MILQSFYQILYLSSSYLYSHSPSLPFALMGSITFIFSNFQAYLPIAYCPQANSLGFTVLIKSLSIYIQSVSVASHKMYPGLNINLLLLIMLSKSGLFLYDESIDKLACINILPR